MNTLTNFFLLFVLFAGNAVTSPEKSKEKTRKIATSIYDRQTVIDEVVERFRTLTTLTKEDIRRFSIPFLFLRASTILADGWEEDLANETVRIINLTMMVDDNFYVIVDPFSKLLLSNNKDRFIEKVTGVLNEEKRALFLEYVASSIRMSLEGNG